MTFVEIDVFDKGIQCILSVFGIYSYIIAGIIFFIVIHPMMPYA